MVKVSRSWWRTLLTTTFLLLCFGTPQAEPENTYFINASKQLGLHKFAAKRVAFVDVNSDGFPDIFILNERTKELHLFLNEAAPNGSRKLRDITQQSGLLTEAKKRFPNFILFADVDNDGDPDAYLNRYCDFERPLIKNGRIVKDKNGKPVPANKDDGLRSLILINDGKGHFCVLKDSGVEKHAETASAASFLDYDNDGCLDLFVGNWYRFYGISYEAYPDRLYRGDGSGHFSEVTQQVGLMTRAEPGHRDSSRPTYGVTHLDYNNDGWQDILVCAYGRQWNMLWENQGGKRFVEVGAKTGVDGDAIRHGRYPEVVKKLWKKRFGREKKDEPPWRANGNTFDAACADFDNDGDIDIFFGEICHWWAGESSDRSMLLVNLGKEKGFAFRRDPDRIKRHHKDPKHWNEGDLHIAWLDFDNDGLLDLLIASGDYPDGQFLRLFRQKPDHTFVDVTKECGFNWEGCGSISLSDFDRDGDTDILVGRSFARLPKEKTRDKIPYAALFINRVGNRNNWLGVLVEGSGKGGANRAGIGCRVVLKAGDLTQMRELRGGAGHCGHQNPPEALFGLGKRKSVDWVEVRWANSKRSKTLIKNPPINCYILIKEGTQGYKVLQFSATKR